MVIERLPDIFFRLPGFLYSVSRKPFVHSSSFSKYRGYISYLSLKFLNIIRTKNIAQLSKVISLISKRVNEAKFIHLQV